jgi:hypothetical protein
MGEVLMDFHVFGISSVGITAESAEVGTQVFAAGPAILAPAARRVNPADADPVTILKSAGADASGFDAADYLMTKDDREHGRWCPAFDFIEFGVTDPAGRNPNQDFVCARARGRDVGQFERSPVLGQATEPA